MKYARLLFLQILLVVALVECGRSVFVQGGNGSETTNGFTASIRYENGDPAKNIPVTLRPVDYVSSTSGLTKASRTSFEIMTDDSGKISVDSLDTGKYVVEINDKNKSVACLVRCTVSTDDGIKKLGAYTLSPFASLTGAVDTVGTSSAKRFVQIYGLERIVGVSPSGAFKIDNLPAAVYTVRIVSLGATIAPAIVENIVARSGETTDLPLIGLTFSKKLYLNTTALGANITKPIVDFPVLVRLRDTTFNFSEALPSGADIRFLKSDNTPLPFEIERWDPVSKRAEIWVKIDTVFGNDNSHYFKMCWGVQSVSVSSATALSSGAAVFDTARGFQAVWHFGQPGNASQFDATINGYDGSPSDTFPVSAQGAIGNGLQFAGAGQYLEMKGTVTGKLDFPKDGTYSLSAWVYLDSIDTNQTFMFGKAHEQYLFQQTLIPGNVQWAFSEYEGKTGWQITQTPPKAGVWKYLVGVRMVSKQILYIDGAVADSSIQTYTPIGVSDRYTTNNFFIGKTPPLPSENPNYFKGNMDEVRVMNTAVSSDFVKLCYMNQKPLDALLFFK